MRNVAEEKSKEVLQQAVEGTKAKDIVGGLLGTKQDTTKKDSAKTANPAQQLLQNKLNNLLKKKKNN